MIPRHAALLASFFFLAVVQIGSPAMAQSDIRLEKATNGSDADSAPGPALVVGDPVTWTYQVTNVGFREITDIEVTDDVEGAVTCPATSLGPGESMTCTLVGTVQSGQYANVGTTTGLLPTEDPVMDTDPSHYSGQTAPSVDLEKATNGVDADTSPGPVLPVDSTVAWTFEVTNIGTETLTNVQVVDDQEGPVACPAGSLEPGEAMTCTVTGTVQPGAYENLGTVTATLPDTTPVAANDPSHHVGQAIVLEKRTEGQDADIPPGPSLQAGDSVTWTYEVSNPGPETVTNLAVTDDQGVTVTCPQTTLAPRESVTCTGSGTVGFGPYANVGTATAQLPLGDLVSDSDPSHYTGPSLRLEKRTNGVDADAPPGPTLVIDSPVTWTYEVTNFGASALTDVSVTDDQGVTVSCPGTTLAAGESMTCTGGGTAQAGQYANVGTVTADLPETGTVTATDPSHYLGVEVYDFGDAADPTYPTRLASDGARHLRGSVYLGSCVDYEVEGQPAAMADGDDLGSGVLTTGTCAVAGDDEDGVVFTAPLVIGADAEVEVTASDSCTLFAWIDFAGDGNFSGTEDDLFPGGQALVAGPNLLSFTVPAATAAAGETVARFRCTTDEAVSFTGEASDGEVEDHAVNVEPPIQIAIDDVTGLERDAGATDFLFTVSVSSTSIETRVTVETVDSTANGGEDYTGVAPTVLTFSQGGSTTQTFPVQVSGDTVVEPNETFTVELSSPSDGAGIADGSGIGTIENDDGASLSINDVTLPEGDSGATPFVFTVTLDEAVQGGLTVDFSTADGSATTADGDYTATSGALTFTGTAGETREITVEVAGDALFEPDETFTVELSNPSVTGAGIADGTGLGTIENDDIDFRSDVFGTKQVTGGEPVPGGTVVYTVVLTNLGPGRQQDNPEDEFEDVLPPELNLVSVASDAGVATAEPGTNTVTWNGEIPAGDSVTITIEATILDNILPGMELANQGIIFYDADGLSTNDATRPTDDPGSPESEDPTVFQVGAASPIPAVGKWGLWLLALAIIALGAGRLRG